MLYIYMYNVYTKSYIVDLDTLVIIITIFRFNIYVHIQLNSYRDNLKIYTKNNDKTLVRFNLI